MNSLSWFVGLRYTLARKQSHLVAFISRISTLGMVLAVSLLITVMSVMNGFDRELRESILAIVPHATLTGFGPVENWQEMVEAAREYPGVAEAAPFSYMQSLMMNRSAVKAVLLYGIDPDYETAHSMLRKLLPAQALEALQQPNTLILGQRLAEKLGAAAGQPVKVIIPASDSTALPQIDYFTVVALLDSGTELDEKLAITHRRNLALLTGKPADSVDGIRIAVDDLFQARGIASDLSGLLSLYYVKDWSRTHGNLYQAVQMSRKLVLLLVFIIIAVAAFNVVSTLVLAVNDKAADIAILRTMGCNNRQILAIFIVQGMVIGVVGVAIGVLLGVLLSLVLSDGVHALEQLIGYQFLRTEVYPVDHLPTDIRALDVLVVALVALLLSILATLFPAWQASRIDPARVLRYE